MYGVTASEGEYGFLDLPGLGDSAVLSPDGTHIAYWLAGRTSGSPHTSDGPAVSGIAIYDTGTGAVARQPIATVHGLSPNELTWASEGRLFYDYNQWRGGDGDSARSQSESDGEAAGTWDEATGTFRSLTLTDNIYFDEAESSPGSPLILSGSHDDVYSVYDLGHPSRSRSFTWGDVGSTENSLTLNSASDRFAAVSGGPYGQVKQPNTVVAGGFPSGPDPAHPRLTFPVVPRSGHTFRVLAWLDRHHVALLRQDPLGGGEVTFRIDRLDVRTGAATTLVHDLPITALDVQFAADLLSSPSAHASPPPSARSPRVELGWWIVGSFLGLGLLLLAVRSSRRA